MISGLALLAATVTAQDVLPFPEEASRGRWGGLQTATISHITHEITEEAKHGIKHYSQHGRGAQGERKEYSRVNVKLEDRGDLTDGKLYFVNNPAATFSVMPPVNGCGNEAFTPDQTSNGSCILATNAGFSTRHVSGGHTCHGTMISNGKVVHESDELNVSFGITVNGTIVVGYLTEQEKQQYAFTQLINGVIWAVRDGRKYIDESIYTEDLLTVDSAECTSPEYCDYREARSARLLLGHDEAGRIMILGLNGFRDDADGPTLDEAADLMIKAGAINAINLDGGGAMSMFENDVLVTSPSDDCANVGTDSEKLGFDVDIASSCVRPVTSILCVSSLDETEPPPTPHNCTSNTSAEDVSLVMITLLVEFLLIFIVALLVYSRRTWPHVWEQLFSMKQQPQHSTSIPAYSRSRTSLGVKKLRKKKSSKKQTRIDVDVDSWNIPTQVNEGSEMGSGDSF